MFFFFSKVKISHYILFQIRHSTFGLQKLFLQSDEGQSFDFEIIGGTPNTANQYVAIAFGTLSQMKDADLYYCSESALSSGVIRERRQTPVALNNMVCFICCCGTKK